MILPAIIKFRLLSNCKTVSGKPNRNGAVLLVGNGKISFEHNVNLGVADSPAFFSTYIYIEARNNTSSIKFGKNIYINNNSCFISEGAEIIIGDDVLIGPNFTVFDSDFHELEPSKRKKGKPMIANVEIMENVFIGSNVTVLKGVKIGKNSVIGSGSVVVKNIPDNVIAAGNPCKVLKPL